MMSTADQAQELRNNLKESGYNQRKATVKVSYPGYDAHITITIKDINADYQLINELANKYHSVDRDDRSGEVLMGGNTWISVEYDRKSVAEAQKAYEDRAKEILNAGYAEIEVIAEKNGRQLLFIPAYKGHDYFETVRIYSPKLIQGKTSRCAYSVDTLAESLLWFNIKQSF